MIIVPTVAISSYAVTISACDVCTVDCRVAALSCVPVMDHHVEGCSIELRALGVAALSSLRALAAGVSQRC